MSIEGHKGDPTSAYDNSEEYPITDRQALKLLEEAVKHRFPITDDMKRAAVVTAVKRLRSGSDRVALRAVKVIAEMERINQRDDEADRAPPIQQNNVQVNVNLHELLQQGDADDDTARRLERDARSRLEDRDTGGAGD